MSSLFSIGAMNQTADALENAGFTSEDLTKLRQFENLPGIKDILYGKAEIKYPEHLINCDAQPYIPDGWSVGLLRRSLPWLAWFLVALVLLLAWLRFILR